MKHCILIDGHNLLHRCYHVCKKQMALDGDCRMLVATFLRDIWLRIELFQAHRVIVCWDKGFPARKKDWPPYKGDRDEKKEAEDKELKAMREDAVGQLADLILPAAGVPCIAIDGIEADDIIGVLARSAPSDEHVLIISSDADLLQLVSESVTFVSPHGTTTLSQFREHYNFHPRIYADYLAITGGHDNMPGVKGVGKIGALQYLRREACPKVVEKIKAQAEEFKLFQSLCKIPYKGTPDIPFPRTPFNVIAWKAEMNRLGLVDLAK